jgi:hypothetical protein
MGNKCSETWVTHFMGMIPPKGGGNALEREMQNEFAKGIY